MASIRQLFVTLELKAEGYLNDMKEAQKEAKELEKVIKPATDAALGMGKTLTAVGGAVAGAFVVATLKTADYGDMLNDAAQRSGIATEKLSSLRILADQNGTSFEELSGNLNKFGKNVSAATDNSSKQAMAFKDLGIKIKDASGTMKPMDQLLAEVGDRFKTLGPGIDKATLAQELFGKGGVAMIPLLNAGSAGMAEAADQAKRLGLVMSGETAQASDEFNDNLDLLHKSVEGVGLTIGKVFLPILNDVFVLITNVIVTVREWADAHPGLIKAVGILAALLTGAGGLLLGLGGLLTVLPAITAAFALLVTPIGLVVLAIGGLTAAFAIFPSFRGVVISVIEAIVESLGAFAGVLGNVAKSAWELVHGQFQQAWDTLKNTSAASMEAAGKATNTFERGLDALSNTFKVTKTETEKTEVATATLHKTLKVNTDEVKKQKAAWDDLQKSLKTLPISGVANDFQALQMKLDGTKDKAQTLFNILKTEPPKVTVALSDQLDAQNALLNSIDDALTKVPLLTAAQNASIVAISTLNDKNREADDLHKKLTETQKAQAAALLKAQADMAQAVNDVKESAGKIFDDMFVKGENVFTSLKNLLEGGALSLGRAIFQDVTAALLGPIKLAFDDFFKGLIESTGIKSFMSDLGAKLGGLIPGIGGGAGGIVGPVLPGASGAGGAVGGGASAATGILGGVISGGISAAGSFLANMRLEGTMNAVEANTRFTFIEIRDMINGPWNLLLNFQQIAVDRLQSIINTLDTMYVLFNERVFGGSTPALAGLTAPDSAASGVTVQNTFNPQYVFYGTPESLQSAIRDEIEPTLMKDLELNARGILERLINALQKGGAGVVAAPAAGVMTAATDARKSGPIPFTTSLFVRPAGPIPYTTP